MCIRDRESHCRLSRHSCAQVSNVAHGRRIRNRLGRLSVASHDARSHTGKRIAITFSPLPSREKDERCIRYRDYSGETEEWKKIDRRVQKVAPIKTNVLLLGETGTGKEVVARALHRRSGRTGEFVAINCGALPRDLLATELFGYEGGAFTGARRCV